MKYAQRRVWVRVGVLWHCMQVSYRGDYRSLCGEVHRKTLRDESIPMPEYLSLACPLCYSADRFRMRIR
jgi:hypothetical protein